MKQLRPGWYPTEHTAIYTLERFWNGRRWSAPCYRDDPREIRARARRTPAESSRTPMGLTLAAHRWH